MKVIIEAIKPKRDAIGAYERVDFHTFDAPDGQGFDTGDEIWFGIDTDGSRTPYVVVATRVAGIELTATRALGLALDVVSVKLYEEIRRDIEVGHRDLYEREYIQWAINHQVWP